MPSTIGFVLLSLFVCDHCEAAVSQKARPIIDYGVRGETFPILERSLLDVIYERLHLAETSGNLEDLSEAFKNKVKARVREPKPVQGLKETSTPRTWLYDPSYHQKTAILDHKGTVIHPAGTRVNPLEHLSWGPDLLFIDGRKQTHVKWALERAGKVVLVSGKPLDLHEEHKRWFYFDQGGALSHKFGLQQVPAVVSQEGLRLRIEEVKP